MTRWDSINSRTERSLDGLENWPEQERKVGQHLGNFLERTSRNTERAFARIAMVSDTNGGTMRMLRSSSNFASASVSAMPIYRP